eukprot:1750106-Pleurochrysis_carterae.AAC.1
MAIIGESDAGGAAAGRRARPRHLFRLRRDEQVPDRNAQHQRPGRGGRRAHGRHRHARRVRDRGRHR